MPTEAMIGLLIVLAVIGLAVYGLVALILKLFGGRARPVEDRRPCVFCGKLTPRAENRCDWCGRDLRSGLAAELADLDALERQLRRFRDRGALKPAVVKDLLGRVKRYRRGIFEEPAPGPAAAPGSPFASSPAEAAAEEAVVAEVVGEPPEVKPPGPAPAPRKPVVAPPKTAAAPRKPAAAPPKPQPELPPAAPVVPPGPRPPAPHETRPRPVAAARPKPQPPAPPPPPRRSWAEMLAAFMEQRNIRWGELIGGLLIVGSSVALVLSLWQTLEGIRYFPFFIFIAISSAVFGVGLYAHHRWKLESTSRGLLVIATLLVPLNFLLMAALSSDDWDAITVLTGVVALGIFAWLVSLAARALVPAGRWLQALAVLGSSATVLVVAWWIGRDSPGWWTVTAGCLPVAFFGTAVGGYLYRLKQQQEDDPSQANALFTLLGTGAFAMAVPLGLLVSLSGGIRDAHARLSLPIALAAVPVLACGLTVVRRMAREASLAAYHTAGTAIALVGMVAMLAALGLAWPHPLGIIAIGGLNCAALILAAFYYRLPILHAGAAACFVLAYLCGFHVVYSGVPLVSGGTELGREILKASSGTALAGPFVLFGLIAEWLARRGLRRHGAIYAGGCGVAAVIGLLLVTYHGLAGTESFDALRAAILYGVYGAGSLALVGRWRRAELSYLGLGLVSAAPVWALWWHSQTHHAAPPLWATMLAAEALVMTVAAAVLQHRSTKEPGTPWRADLAALRSGSLADLYRVPLLHVAEVVAPLTVALAVALGVWSEFWASAPTSNSPWPVLTAACIAAAYLLLAWGYRSPQRTWVGSVVVLLGLVHTLAYNYTGLIGRPWLAWLVALLTHATAAVAAGVLLDEWTRRRPDRRPAADARQTFTRPLGGSALLSSGLAWPVILWACGNTPEMLLQWQNTLSLACCLFWLAAVWLVISWRSRHAELFAAHQAVLAVAALVATAAWLEYPQSWVKDLPGDLFVRPQSLQAYGIVLGLLSLGWIVVRIVLRGDSVARKLLHPRGPSVDRIIRHAVVGLQLLLIGWHLLPGFTHELLPRSSAPTETPLAAGGGAWMLLALMAAVLVVTLWYRWRISMLSSLLLAATIPCLVAGQGWVVDNQAVASALRWGSAVCFVACSVAVWERKRLLGAFASAGANIDVGPAGPRIARATLLATTAAPVLALTIIAALLQVAKINPAGPAADSLFDRLGPNPSYLVPLVLVMVGLVGHAVRERSAGYAFSAGLVGELIVTLGYALHVMTTGDEAFGVAEFVTLLQIATIAAAVWAIAWLAVRGRLNVWLERPGRASHGASDPAQDAQDAVGRGRQPSHNWDSARSLMNVQLGMGIAGNVVLLAWALGTLALVPVTWQGWTVAAGSPLGWIALVSAVAACVYRQGHLGRLPSPNAVGLIGMAALGLLACTIRGVLPQWGYGPEWGYRTLMLGWATYAWFIVSATWWVATVRTLPGAEGPPQALIRAAAVWVRVAGILAVVLGLKAAFWHHEEQLWAAAAIAVASAAGATMAVWRRREGWAFSAALGVNLAASLVVWHFQRRLDFGQWWPRLIQANVIASSAWALVWLAARKRLYRLRELTLGESPLLATQTAIPVVVGAVLLMVPVVWLVLAPGDLPEGMNRLMAQLAEPPGWIGLLLAAGAAAWYLRQVLPGNLLHVLGGLGLGAGVLAACYAPQFSARSGWFDWDDRLAYHTLGTAWAVVGLIVLGLGLLGRNLRLAAEDDPQSPQPLGQAPRATTGQLIFPGPFVRAWVTAIGALVLLLALIHSAADPTSPWWSGWAVLTVSVMAGMLAMWMRRAEYVFASGLLLNVIGTVAWMAWQQPPTPGGFVQANVLCFGVGSAVWSLLRAAHPAGVPHAELGGRRLPFSHLAARCALGLLAVVVAVAVVCHAFGLEPDAIHVIGRLDWFALAATAAAVAICLWDRSSRLALPGLYGLGLLAVGMGLCGRGLLGHEFCHAAAIELAGFVLAAASLGALLPRLTAVWQALRIPGDQLEGGARRGHRSAGVVGPADWFPAGQAVAAAAAAALSVWISIDARFDATAHPALGWPSGRMVGPLAVALLLAAALLLAGRCKDRWREAWQYAALGLGLAIFSELGWARLAPDGPLAWLRRSVILMVAAVATALVAGLGLRRLLPATSDWIAAGRRATPVLGGLALAALAAVLVQEGLLFELEKGTPMAWPAIVVVAVALAALIAGCIGFAVRPDWDPLGLGERQRQLYVYVAEALGGLIGLHIWFTMPWLFTRGIVRRYWMLIAMAVAFVGVGLSEWFHRRRMPVLSDPLERTARWLPLAPAIGYWLMPKTDAGTWFLGQASPAMWFLMGLFYGYMAAARRSLWMAAAGILTANIGLWVLWGQQMGWSFWEHPQLWLIPIALTVLVAEHLDRRRLIEPQRTALRYVALGTIYVSSTVEFWRGIGESVWLPLVLIGLSVLGVLAGMLLRVRSFLYLGSVFLTVVIGRLIFYAAFEQGEEPRWWIIWTCCIALGAAIIALFAVFEKRKNDILSAVERFRGWEG